MLVGEAASRVGNRIPAGLLPATHPDGLGIGHPSGEQKNEEEEETEGRGPAGHVGVDGTMICRFSYRCMVEKLLIASGQVGLQDWPVDRKRQGRSSSRGASLPSPFQGLQNFAQPSTAMVQPYSVHPWADEPHDVIAPLRTAARLTLCFSAQKKWAINFHALVT